MKYILILAYVYVVIREQVLKFPIPIRVEIPFRHNETSKTKYYEH